MSALEKADRPDFADCEPCNSGSLVTENAPNGNQVLLALYDKVPDVEDSVDVASHVIICQFAAGHCSEQGTSCAA